MEKEILIQVSKEFNLPQNKVEQIYKDWLEYVKNKINNTDYSTYSNQYSFTIPLVGKIYVNKIRLENINKSKNDSK